MEIVGYASIKKNAKSGIALTIDKFLGKDLRVLEFSFDGGVMVVTNDATEIAMFDKNDVTRFFKCVYSEDMIFPPDSSITEQILYRQNAQMRKGGYNPLLKAMVIQCSLSKGVFTDTFLWQKK